MAFATGFDLTEALDLLAMSGIVEGGDAPPKPAGWNIAFDSPVIGPFDEKWQLWKSDAGAFAVVLRGTVMKAGSILEDLISILVRATGSLTVGPNKVDYQFAADPDAGVHLGFALGTLLVLKDPAAGILAKLAAVPAGSNIYIAGHSQGAAMATLLRSYLEYAPDAPKNYSYKTYAYAQPKPGNDHYAADFESRFSNPGLAFRVTNSLDWVPQVPFTLEIASDINRPNPLSVMSPSFLLTMLMRVMDPLVEEARRFIETHARAHLQTKAVALARKVSATATPATTLLAGGFDVPVLPSLNFVNAGTEAALIGAPCAGDQCHDAFFEHHATTYFDLLKAQWPRA